MNDREAIDAAVAAWNEGGPDAFLEHLAPDVEWHAAEGFPEGTVWHDRESLAPVMREQFGSVFTGARIELQEAVEGPGGWLVGGRQSAVHDSGVEVDWVSWFVVHLEDGLVRRIWLFMDREPALRQAGLDG